MRCERWFRQIEMNSSYAKSHIGQSRSRIKEINPSYANRRYRSGQVKDYVSVCTGRDLKMSSIGRFLWLAWSTLCILSSFMACQSNFSFSILPTVESESKYKIAMEMHTLWYSACIMASSLLSFNKLIGWDPLSPPPVRRSFVARAFGYNYN